MQRVMFFLLALALTGPALAEPSDIQRLARDAGLSDRQLRMMMGAPSGFAEYRTSYAMLRERLRRAEAAAMTEDAPEPIDTTAPQPLEREVAPEAEAASTYPLREE